MGCKVIAVSDASGAYGVPVNWHFTAEEAGYITGANISVNGGMHMM